MAPPGTQSSPSSHRPDARAWRGAASLLPPLPRFHRHRRSLTRGPTRRRLHPRGPCSVRQTVSSTVETRPAETSVPIWTVERRCEGTRADTRWLGMKRLQRPYEEHEACLLDGPAILSFSLFFSIFFFSSRKVFFHNFLFSSPQEGKRRSWKDHEQGYENSIISSYFLFFHSFFISKLLFKCCSIICCKNKISAATHEVSSSQ